MAAAKFSVGTRIEVDLFSPKTGEYQITRKATITGRYEIGASEEILRPTSAVDKFNAEEFDENHRMGYLVKYDGSRLACAFEDARDFRHLPE